jgi:transaldolase
MGELMTENRLKRILAVGQSVWCDNIQRNMITDGIFKKMITEDGLRGVTSNPTIFDKAISGSKDYDAEITKLLGQGVRGEDLYWKLVIRDIQDAADVFLPVYNESKGLDGYISIEVSPLLANDTKNTIQQARELHKKVGRKNIMVKVPATEAGIPAIKQLIADGININVTLIFSVDRYKAVMEAYMAGLEERHWAGKPVSGIQSVASFFVSRVDGVIDAALLEKGSAEAKALLGKAAIANSKIAYEEFRKFFNGARYKTLKQMGAAVQRPLWASTSTKNPDYSDVMYAEALMGPNTVNTLPPATLEAYRDHGDAADRIGSGLDEAKAQLKALADLGIDLKAVTEKLELQGVQSFIDSFNQLIAHLNEKQVKLASA